LLRLGARAGSLAETAAASQLGAVTDAVSVRVAGRLAAPEADGSLTISTSGIAKAGGHWWVTGDLRQFSLAGAEDGSGGNLTFGIDRVTERGLLIGLYAGQHWLGIGDGTTDRVGSLAFGVYLGVPVGPALVLDGHFGMARPKLETGGSTVASDRFMAALGLAGSWTSGAVILSPSLRVSGYDEEVPACLDDGLLREAERLRAWALTVGLRVLGAQAIGGTGLVPYGKLSLARAMTRSDLAGTTGYSAPRAALGLVGTVGAGSLSAELSGGTLTDKVSDAGLRPSYLLEF
jgi:hypothetical protein